MTGERSATADGRAVVAEQVGWLILGGPDEVPLEPDRPHDHLAILSRAALAHTVTRDLLQQSVAAARGSGHSWAAIGDELGLTRQAAQQRFGGVTAVDAGPDLRWLGPVTAFDEMGELALAGRRGWHTVGVGMLKHQVMRTDTQWEHRRVVWRRPATTFETDGWHIAVRAFPWLYLVRDLGIPAED
ncbi:MAG: hypothetical protein KBB39_11535 [Phycicoccus sp.]|nr:hypothetical protein [Phycicoccus sp.]